MTKPWNYVSLEQETLQQLVPVSVATWGFLFVSFWFLLKTCSSFFRKLSRADQADTISRCNSSIHTLLACPMYSYGVLFTEWNSIWEPTPTATASIPGEQQLTSPTVVIQLAFVLSIGYFLWDSVVCLWYRLPSWQLFFVHHVVATSPYLTYCISPIAGERGIFILAMFMHVEYTCFFFNPIGFLETWGYGPPAANLEDGNAKKKKSDGKFPHPFYTRIYQLCCFAMVPFWLVFRVINVIFIVYSIHKYVLPAMPDETRYMLYPAATCGWVITLSCCAWFYLNVLPAAKVAAKIDFSSSSSNKRR